MSGSNQDLNPEEPCVVCFKRVRFYSIGSCDHPVCYECCTRMRVLCQQNECPICRQDMQKVFFTDKVCPFKSLDSSELHLVDRKYKIWFASRPAQQAYNALLQHKCPICPQTFSIFKSLEEHVSREHRRFYCDLCNKNLKIFSSERRCYDRSQLSTHRRIGDEDDKSHKGHPLCEFCDVRYMDSDELYRHLRRDHFFCHFCDADGHHYYFNDYPDLKEHFLKEHFLCQEENCVNEQFTSVFRTEIDLKAHVATTHGRTLGKHATKQAKKIELELSFPTRSNQRGRGNDTRQHPGEPSRQNLFQEAPYQPPVPVDINSEEFPSLGGGAPVVPVQSTRRRQVQEAFPALAPVDNTSNAAAAVNGREKWTAPKPRPPPASSRVSQPLPSSSQDFPSLPTASTVSQAQALSWTGVAKTKKPPPPSPSKAPVKKPSKTVLSISKNIQNRSNNTQSAASNNNNNSQKTNANVGSQRMNASANTNGRTNPSIRSKTAGSRERYSDEDDYNFHDDDISQYNLNSRALPPPAFSKVTLIKSAPPRPVSQNNMNSANVQDGGAGVSSADAAASTSKKVKMKGRIRGEDFPVLEAAPRAPASSGPGPAPLEYTLPPNFSARNASLFENIGRHIGPLLTEFKSMSSLFMRQGLNAEEYYAYCLSSLGRNAFNEIFPELLVLLPMIDRQKALWRAHHSNPSAKNKKVVARLDQCAVCGQVIAMAELKYHLDAHKKAGHMQPAPSTAQKKVPSAWGK